MKERAKDFKKAIINIAALRAAAKKTTVLQEVLGIQAELLEIQLEKQKGKSTPQLKQ